MSGMLLGPEIPRTSMVCAPGARNRVGKTIKCVGHRILRKNVQLSQLNEIICFSSDLKHHRVYDVRLD